MTQPVGELRPSQLLFSFGVGAIIDLPNLSVLTLGLDDWDASAGRLISEDRLLGAVRRRLGPQVDNLLAPPVVTDADLGVLPQRDAAAPSGVPVLTFPRWLVCPLCRLLAPLQQGSFELRPDRYHPDRTGYVHTHCSRASTRPPLVFPARFLMACPAGHLDDFPWLFFVHGGATSCPGPLRLYEVGPSGEARDVEVGCSRCPGKQRMARAFGEEGYRALPACRARRVHLLDEEAGGCPEEPRTVLIGASNLWFPASISVLSIPVSGDRVEQAVADAWAGFLDKVTTRDALKLVLSLDTPHARRLRRLPLDDVWAVIERRRQPAPAQVGPVDVRGPEWLVFSRPASAPSSADFHLRRVEPPVDFEAWIQDVVLVERLREVQALTGFTRIESPADPGDFGVGELPRLVPLSRRPPQWAPATEARGEGLFIRFREDVVEQWSARQHGLTAEFLAAHREWRRRRGIEPPDAGFPGLRYCVLHTFAHTLVRELSLECGYSIASLRERLYAREAGQEGGPMAGLLLYTVAPDSEGTLGGLVRRGEPDLLGEHLRSALYAARLCSSDPLCAEARPTADGRILNGAACHSCLFAPETFCERGNRFLDRALLVPTVAGPGGAFLEEVQP